jgi:lysyl endopeptidase
VTIRCCRLALAALVSCSAIAQGAIAPVVSVPPAELRPAKAEGSAPFPRSLRRDAPAHRVDLAVPTATEVAAFRAHNALSAGAERRRSAKALAVGFGRDLPIAARTITLSALPWVTDGEGGRSARIEIHSPDAAALRVAMRLPIAGPGLSVRFAGGDGTTIFGPFPADAIAVDAARFGQFWSPVLEGDVAIIEIHAGAGVPVDGVTLMLPRVAHQVVGSAEMRSMSARSVSEIGLAQSCNIDVACIRPGPALSDAARAVAKLLFVGDNAGTQYLCTGTLLNDLPSTNKPYLFTAGHCMGSANAAHTLNTFWFFDAVACKDNTVPPFVQLTAGAELLGRSQDHDWALVRLNEPPPAGTRFAAWNARPVPIGVATTTLHHPLGDLKKYARGYVGQAVYLSDSVVEGTFNEVPYTSGITEGGSSGAALLTFLDSGGYFEVRGGISEGNLVTCPAAPGSIYDDYSRMEDMLPLVRQYLTPTLPNPDGKVVAVEFYNRQLDHYFLTANPYEIDDLDAGAHGGWERTGLRFLAYVRHAPGTNPVCRFYRAPAYGDSHFYSASPEECAATAAQHPADWVYESPAVFYIRLPDAAGRCPAGTQPVWRFFNQTTANHRYTAEAVLRDEMRVRPSVWVAEGYGQEQAVMCAALQ